MNTSSPPIIVKLVPGNTDKPSVNKKVFYQQLDGLRAFAVLGVMVSHWLFLPVIKKLGLGFVGVNLFFVLSGFLITEILLKQIQKKETPNKILKSFYIKRSLRIFPIYYLVILFCFLISFEQSRDFLIYSLTYTLNFYNASTGDLGGSLGHLWSLCVEEQFYLVWPFLLLAVRPRYHLTLIIALIFGALGFRLIFSLLEFHNYSIYNYRIMAASLDALGLGALLAYLKLFKPDFLKRLLRMYAIPIMAAFFYLLLSFRDNEILLQETFLRFLVATFSFYLIGNGIAGFNNWFGTLLENKWIQFFGKISYGLYLYHLILTGLLRENILEVITEKLLPSLPGIFQYNVDFLIAPVLLLITVLVASVSYYAIELPFLKLKNRF